MNFHVVSFILLTFATNLGTGAGFSDAKLLPWNIIKTR